MEDRYTRQERGGRKVAGNGRWWVTRGAGGEKVKGGEEGKML